VRFYLLCPPRAHPGDVADLAKRLTKVPGLYPRGEYDVIHL